MFNQLIELFMRFPGIGPRQARRFVYFLAGENSDYVKNLGEMILSLKKQSSQCSSCFRFFAINANLEVALPGERICPICANSDRDSSLLMVVEKDVDLENIEKTGVYNGKYFVLGGSLSLATAGKDNKDKIRFRELFEKVKKDMPKEIILATSATVEGENTARYAAKILEPLLAPLKAQITHLGRGLSTGAELEYLDSETLNNALKNRK